jgi:hypothetical protein
VKGSIGGAYWLRCCKLDTAHELKLIRTMRPMTVRFDLPCNPNFASNKSGYKLYTPKMRCTMAMYLAILCHDLITKPVRSLGHTKTFN